MPEIKQLPSRSTGRQWMVVTAAAAIIEFGAAYHALNLPADVPVSLIAPLELVAALVWGILLSLTTWRIARHKARGVWLLLAFVVYSVARLVIFTRADYDHNRLPFLW